MYLYIYLFNHLFRDQPDKNDLLNDIRVSRGLEKYEIILIDSVRINCMRAVKDGYWALKVASEDSGEVKGFSLRNSESLLVYNDVYKSLKT